MEVHKQPYLQNMAKIITPLNAATIAAAKPTGKQYKLSDGNGLVLVVLASGSKKWRFYYTRRDKKKDTISIGDYPALSLADARLKREEYRTLIANNIDPKQGSSKDIFNSFQSIAEQWFERRKRTLTPDYTERVWTTLSNNVLSRIGKMNISEIKPRDIVLTGYEIFKFKPYKIVDES